MPKVDMLSEHLSHGQQEVGLDNSCLFTKLDMRRIEGIAQSLEKGSNVIPEYLLSNPVKRLIKNRGRIVHVPTAGRETASIIGVQRSHYTNKCNGSKQFTPRHALVPLNLFEQWRPGMPEGKVMQQADGLALIHLVTQNDVAGHGSAERIERMEQHLFRLKGCIEADFGTDT